MNCGQANTPEVLFLAAAPVFLVDASLGFAAVAVRTRRTAQR
jgi:hypothetical protein